MKIDAPRWWQSLRISPAILIGLLICAGPLQAAAPEPGWLDAAGQPSTSAQHALRLLVDAAADGLDPSDYQAAELAERAALLSRPAATAPAQQLAFSSALDMAMQRYLRDLHLGRVDPRALGFRVAAKSAAQPDFAALVKAAVAEDRLPLAVEALRPKLGQYAKLRVALARYRALASDASPIQLPIAATKVKRGEPYCGGVAVYRLLLAVGDMPADAAAPIGCTDAALAAGIKRFQARHGLAPDGVVGRETLAALQVPLAHRVQQLELALERVRWLPELSARPFIGINIPMFRLWAYDPDAPGETSINMGVVVGRALNTQTPVMAEDMRYLIFRPYWNVPRSIVRNEVLPALARDPRYLQRHDMEIVRGGGDDAKPVAASSENLAALSAGTLRLRQRPGPKNSLGRVKFIFPNDDNIYLHDTPATQLFGRARRDFSHGCVRVEHPVALAQWVLQHEQGWTRERIEAAMAGAAPQRVDLSRPLPVILFYMTAMVMPVDQGVYFASDIYGHDARLVSALAGRPALETPFMR